MADESKRCVWRVSITADFGGGVEQGPWPLEFVDTQRKNVGTLVQGRIDEIADRILTKTGRRKEAK